jgi:iron complex transport system permease protein
VRSITGWILAVAVLIVAIAASLAIGSRDIPIATVWHALVPAAGGAKASAEDLAVVLDLRVPRTVIGLAAGLALGLSGAVMQAVTRNPLADPGILGVTSGAAFSVAIAVGVLGITAVSGYLWFAFGGALVAAVVVYLVGSAGRRGASVARLILTGVALGAVLSGITSAMLLANPQGFNAMAVWQSGSLADRGWTAVVPVTPFLVVGVVLTFLIGGRLNVLALGDDVASAMGVNLVVTRLVAVAAVTLLAGGATAIAGPIAFIGLMVPHVARWIVGPDYRWIFAYTAVLAPTLLLAADILGRVVLRPGELPAGIVTACIGAPVLIALVRRDRAISL